MSALCVAGGCATWSYHVAGCAAEPQCWGCRPREAADGLRLCLRDVDLLAQAARKAAENHHALLFVLGGRQGGMREVVAGSRDRGIALNLGAASARYEIESSLRRLCALVASERSVTPPDDRGAHWYRCGEFLAVHARWLAAREDAGEIFGELRELAHGWPWRVAFPASGKPPVLGRCPVKDCAGVITGRLDEAAGAAAKFASIQCDAPERHTWSRERLYQLWPRLLDLADPPVLSAAEATVVLGVGLHSIRRFVAAGRLSRAPGGYTAESVMALHAELWPNPGVIEDASVAV